MPLRNVRYRFTATKKKGVKLRLAFRNNKVVEIAKFKKRKGKLKKVRVMKL